MYSTDRVAKTSETTDRFIYAVNVVAQSLKSTSPAWFSYGINTAVVRLLDMFAWRTVWMSLLWFIFFINLFSLVETDGHKVGLPVLGHVQPRQIEECTTDKDD
jgi:hypothetical protein